MENIKPLISIITVVYNDVHNIEKTINSVFNQSYKNIEYIIIDGGSTDGTIDVINNNQEKITDWISEPDRGIYDAMNKGIERATGKWINFMNCGDYFFSNFVLENVFAEHSFSEEDFIYGSAKFYKSDGSLFDKHVPYGIEKIWKGPNFRHGALFAPSDVIKKYKFDLDETLKVSADFDFIYKCYKYGYKFVEVSETILVFQEDGVSNNYLRCLKDNYFLVKKYKELSPSRYLYYAKLRIVYKIKKSIISVPIKFLIQFFLSYFPNYVINIMPFYFLRHFYYRKIIRIKLGKQSSIHMGVQVFGKNIVIGDYTTINRKVHLDGRGKLIIGNNVSISQNCFLLTADHDYNSPNFSYRAGEISIDDYAWLGTNVMILPNIHIGKGAVICAGAVVTKSVMPYTVVAGIPAKEIGKRNQQEHNYRPIDFSYCD